VYCVLYAVTGFGPPGRDDFFCSQRLFYWHSVIDSVNGQRWSWRVYLVNRLTRLQMVLFPALILGATWTRSGCGFLRRLPFTTAVCISYTHQASLCGRRVRSFSRIYSFCRALFHRWLAPNGTALEPQTTNSGIHMVSLLVLAAASGAGIRNRFLYADSPQSFFGFSRRADQSLLVIWLAGALVERLKSRHGVRAPRIQVLMST